MIKHRHKGKYRYVSKKGRVYYKRKPLHKLTKEKREIYQKLDKKKYETGGRMDFNEKGLERGDIWFGTDNRLQFPDDPDMEVDWHTHPNDYNKKTDKMNYFPSTHDLKGFKKSASQYSMIMHKGRVMGLKKTKKLNLKNLNKIEKGLEKDSNLPVDKLYKKYKPEYEKMGLKTQFHKKGTTIKLPIRVIE